MTKSQEAQITFYGGTESVTGSNFLFEYKNTKILIDCGLFQGKKFCEDVNRKPFPYDPKDIDGVVVTHGHLDHVGRLPKLVHDGLTAPIYSTQETKEIARLILEDGAQLMRQESEEEGTQPVYLPEDVEKTLAQWETRDYHTSFSIGDIDVFLKDAGHILGSAMVELTTNGTKTVFTGDLGNSPAPLLRPTENISGATYLVMESVYGDRNHESVGERLHKLEDIIEGTIRNKGVLMIPAFSIERTQVLLSEINKLIERGSVPHLPVFLDSPLAIKVTEVYKKGKMHFNKYTKEIIASGDDIFKFPGLTFTDSVEESKAINDVPSPKIIIAGSGMSQGGRIIHHEARYLSDPNSTLLIVGFQAAGSLGRKILDGAKEVEINGATIPIRAQVRTIFSYSSHMDSDHLVEFVHDTLDTLRKVFVAIGEPRGSLFLAQRLRDYLGVNAEVPQAGQTVRLEV